MCLDELTDRLARAMLFQHTILFCSALTECASHCDLFAFVLELSSIMTYIKRHCG
jgi:hypothetical protein